MATLETLKMDSIISRTRRSMMLLAGTALAATVFTTKAGQRAAVTDTDILNFALNLEYLEANFYSLADSGQTIDQLGIGVGAGSTATGTVSVVTKSGGPAACKVPFTSPIVAAYCKETAIEERAHVTDLRQALSTAAVAQPSLDLYNSFLALGGLIGAPTFDPFSADLYFLLGAYIFEDVGVSAYHGAASLITDKVKVASRRSRHPRSRGLPRRSRPHHPLPDGRRQSLGRHRRSHHQDLRRPRNPGTAPSAPPRMITASLPAWSHSTEPPQPTSGSNIVDADANSLGWARTTTQVLNIVYASAATAKGGFYPNGLNGTIA